MQKLRRIVGLYNLARQNKRGAKKKLARFLGLKFSDIAYDAFDSSRRVQRRFDPIAHSDFFQKVFQHLKDLKDDLSAEKSRKNQKVKNWWSGEPRPPGTRIERNLFSDFVNRVSRLKLLFAELESEEPMDKWPPEKLSALLYDWPVLKEKFTRAEMLQRRDQKN